VEVRKYDAARGGGFCITSKKIVAVALAAAMCLGMSVTAFASKNDDTWSNDALWSPDYLKSVGPTSHQGQFASNMAMYTRAMDQEGHVVDITWKELSKGALESIGSEKKVKEIFEKNGYAATDKMDFIPMLDGSITFEDGVPTGGGVVTFALNSLGVNSEGIEPGDTVYLMQETAPGSGVWEVYAAEVGENYDIAVNIPRNGSLVLVKVMSNGDVITVDKTTGNVVDRVPAGNTDDTKKPAGTTGSSSNASAGTSPKTGEF